jgi:sugar phosphate isomerase/epimerase
MGDTWVDYDLLNRDLTVAMRDRARSRGLQVCSLNALRKSLCAPGYVETNQRALEHALDVAAWLDCPILGISLSQPTNPPGGKAVMGTTQSPAGSFAASAEDYETTVVRLRPLLAIARPRGIALSIELHHCSIADTSAGVLRLLDALGEPDVGANPDLINGYWAYAEPPETWRQAIEALAPRSNLWHVKNANRVYMPDLHRAVYLERTLGQGDIDYRWAVGVMRNAGFDGWIAIENCGTTDPFEVTAEGRRYLERVLRSRVTVRLAPRPA